MGRRIKSDFPEVTVSTSDGSVRRCCGLPDRAISDAMAAGIRVEVKEKFFALATADAARDPGKIVLAHDGPQVTVAIDVDMFTAATWRRILQYEKHRLTVVIRLGLVMAPTVQSSTTSLCALECGREQHASATVSSPAIRGR